MNPFVKLARSNLEGLKSGFAHGSLKYGVTKEALIQHGAPPDSVEALEAYLNENGLEGQSVPAMLEAILETQDHAYNAALNQSLVVTGPEVSGVTNLKTGSRFLQVVEHAKRELMLATFALFRGDQILAPIHEAMKRNPQLEVTLIVHVGRRHGDSTLTSQIVENFRQEFFSKHWPWEELRPRVFYFPSSLEMKSSLRGAMHAKFVIADEQRCFITSANFTEAAQSRNIEIGVEISDSHEPKTLAQYFKALIKEGQLVELDKL